MLNASGHKKLHTHLNNQRMTCLAMQTLKISPTVETIVWYRGRQDEPEQTKTETKNINVPFISFSPVL